MQQKKREKAWTMIVFDGTISHCTSRDGFNSRALFFSRKEAFSFKKNYLLGGKDAKAHRPKVVPCTIEYSLPPKSKKACKCETIKGIGKAHTMECVFGPKSKKRRAKMV